MKSYSLEELAKHHELTGSVACRYIVESDYQALELQNAELVAKLASIEYVWEAAMGWPDTTDEMDAIGKALKSSPAECLRDIQAEAGRAGWLACWNWISSDENIEFSETNFSDIANQYAERVKAGE